MTEKLSARPHDLLPSERRRNMGIAAVRMASASDASRWREGVMWYDLAKCVGEDPDLFFPEGKEGRWIAQIEDAKKICGKCLVKDKCLKYALSTHSDEGIWGGLTEEERRAYRRKEQRRTQK